MSFSKCKPISLFLLLSLLCPLEGVQAQSAPTVPPVEQQMYSALNLAVGSFQSSLDTRTQSASSTAMTAKLDSAAAANGPGLLTKAALPNVAKQLSDYRAMGVQSVVVDMSFPIMCPEFFSANPGVGTFQQYYTFYQNVFQQCRNAGIKVLVESHPIFPSAADAFTPIAARYAQSLSASAFQADMAESNCSVALLKPDCISIVSEPNTDFAWTGQSVYQTPTALAGLVQVCTQAINGASPNTLVAAGAPNWQADAQKYDSLLYQIQGLGAIDIHIYFCGNNGLENATALADNAHSNGKQLVVSESWLSKTGTGVPPARPQPAQADIERANAVFSFWQPLDAQFIYSMFKWCNVEQPTFYTFFFSQLLFANLNYNQVNAMTNVQIIQAERQAEQAAISADQVTNVGAYFAKLLTAPRQSQY